mgnify:CR=1 FL=1|tara:strand:- start:1096 stop:1836 length:741 start_codon:yes stop_codon:yes gene_type:complete
MNRKYAIFNKSSTDNFSNGHHAVPIDTFRGASPVSDTELALFFLPFIGSGVNSGADNLEFRLTITANKHKEVMQSIATEFSTGEKYLITIADVETSNFIDSNITDYTIEASNAFAWDAGYLGNREKIKLIPSDFIADDGGNPVMIDDTGSDRWVESNGTNKLFASVVIPQGFKATAVTIYGSATSAVTVYEADIDSKSVTSKGTGNIGTAIDITDVTAGSTNYLLIELAQASGEEVYGGEISIAIV